MSADLMPYWKVKGSLTVCERFLMFNDHITIPKSLWRETMDKIHQGHQGIERCRMRVQHLVWWPGVSQSISQKVLQCPSCAKEAKHRKKPLITTSLPEYPWQVVGTDLFELDGSHSVLVVDYFSRYPELTKLTSTLSSNVINALKVAFSRHGILEIVRSDNGPQYSSL